jgi:phosphatidate cytidylyltransferase
MSNTAQRVLVALLAIPVAIGVVYAGGLPLALLISVIAFLGARELIAIARAAGVAPLAGLAAVASAAIPVGTWLAYGGSVVTSGGLDWEAAVPSPWFALAILVLAVLAGTLARRSPNDRPLETAAVTILIPLYCAVLPSFLLGIRFATGPDRSWTATWAVFFPLAITWIGDTAAMYGGKLLEGPKLAPTVSPGKTRSGSIAGLAAGVIAAVVYDAVALKPSGFTIGLPAVLAVGVVCSVAAQVGDLAESLFKRQVGIKDSSGLIPGHGGVLDRFDALYFVVPIAAMLYRLLGVI